MKKFSRLANVLVLIVLLTPGLFAAEDLTGKWSGSFNISVNGAEQRPESAYMVLKHNGKELTGTAGPRETEQWPILNGTVTVTGTAQKESIKAMFDVSERGSGPVLHFELELIGGHLKGNAKAEQDGITVVAALDLTRVK